MKTAEKLIDLAKEGLSAWKTFIATRQEAYERKQDKKQVLAIECGEKMAFNVDELIAKIEIKYPDAIKDREFSRPIKQYKHFRRKFFKYH